jgi:type IV pilus assembly protein PilM
VGLVLPDPVARISLLPPSELSEGGTPLPELIRFRLKKSLPFDVREARLAHLGGGPFHVAVAIASGVLSDYEGALARAGLEPGLVELSGLALAEAACPAEGDWLLLNWEPGYLSLFLFRNGWPILVRTLSGLALDAGSVAREVGQTLVYAQERLEGASLRGAAIRCPGAVFEAARAPLEESLGVALQALDPWAFVGGGPAELRGDTGLAGALASLRRAVA